jgi:uncharacterized protein
VSWATAAASGSFALATNLPLRTVLATAAGGLLAGYGARLVYGNVGSYFGGIALFSLHGWIWAFAVLAVTWLGLQTRRLLGLGVPKRTDSVC